MASSAFRTRRSMRPRSAEPARLDDYRLVFNEGGIPYVEPAFANIEPAPGARVWGVLYDLPCGDLELLSRDESQNYRCVEVAVHGACSGEVVAQAYQSARVREGRLPSRRYLGLLIEGAREHGLPDEYVQELAGQASYYHPVWSRVGDVLIPIYTKLRRRGLRHEDLFRWLGVD